MSLLFVLVGKLSPRKARNLCSKPNWWKQLQSWYCMWGWVCSRKTVKLSLMALILFPLSKQQQQPNKKLCNIVWHLFANNLYCRGIQVQWNYACLTSGGNESTYRWEIDCLVLWCSEQFGDQCSIDIGEGCGLREKQMLYFLRQLKKINPPKTTRVHFYTATTEAILISSITIW